MNDPLTAAPISQANTPQISPEEQALLNQLADIALPDPIGWWHFSGLFWIASIAALITLGIFAYGYWQRAKANRYRAEALTLLQGIQQNASQAPAEYPAHKVMQAANTLLKRCCYTAAPASRAVLAKQYGQHWYMCLFDSVKPHAKISQRDNTQLAEQWQQASYTNETPTNMDLQLYFSFCAHWIKHNQLAQHYPSNRATWWSRFLVNLRGRAND